MHNLQIDGAKGFIIIPTRRLLVRSHQWKRQNNV